MKNFVKIIVIAIVVFGCIYAAVSLTQNYGKPSHVVTTENALKDLNKLYQNISVKTLPLQKSDTNIADDNITILPDISEYPFIVNPTTDHFITIYSSTEKAGYGYESWLTDVAKRFNDSQIVINGETVSVGVRAMTSELACDFISSGKYTPELYTPTSQLYATVLKANQIEVSTLKDSLVHNVSGIVVSKSISDNISEKSIKGVVDYVLNHNAIVTYANPLSNEDGLNFVLALLHNFNETNPFGEEAAESFRKYQDKLPYVTSDIYQLKESFTSGMVDGFITNYQFYSNQSELKDKYEFIPFGMVQAEPLYQIGNLTDIKSQIAQSFADFCMNAESQAAAKEKGFNTYHNYNDSGSNWNANTIAEAKKLWKKEKNGTSDLTAVFVADVSGSMEGSPLLKLKASLNRAASFIDENVNIGLVTFSNQVNIALPIAKFDDEQKAYFSNAVRNMTAMGGTAMFDAVIVAEKMLAEEQIKNPNTRLMMFVLTDGESNRGHKLEDIETISKNLEIPIYTIGYNANIDVLETLSNINEASTMNAETDNVIYKLESLFNAQM